MRRSWWMRLLLAFGCYCEAYASKRQRWVELQRLKNESDIYRGYDSAARATPRDERHRRRSRSTGLSGRCYNEPAGGRRIESAAGVVENLRDAGWLRQSEDVVQGAPARRSRNSSARHGKSGGCVPDRTGRIGDGRDGSEI